MSETQLRRPRPKQWAQFLAQARTRMVNSGAIVVEGTLSRMVGMTLEAIGCEVVTTGGPPTVSFNSIQLDTSSPQAFA
ncbi:MAG: hypothetical protein ACLQJ0_07695, partial [Steroidobacteraceae bacterium]